MQTNSDIAIPSLYLNNDKDSRLPSNKNKEIIVGEKILESKLVTIINIKTKKDKYETGKSNE